MNCYLRKARQGEENTIYAMIAARIKWMDDSGIHQWNDTDYLEVYPLDYYVDNLERIFVLAEKKTERILCAAIVLTQDKRWDAIEPSFYIHNFVSALDNHRAGMLFIQMLEKQAERENVSYIRLDSAADNERLASYYEELGFKPCGVCLEGKYHGILRQKEVAG